MSTLRGQMNKPMRFKRRAKDSGTDVNTIKLSEVKPKNQRELLVFPDKCVSLLVGEPGLGKSQIIASLIAMITRGEKGPCNYGKPRKPGKVILVAPEDDAASILRPRLELAKANLRRVVFWNRSFDLASDLTELRNEADQCSGLRAIIIDPLGACLSSINQNDHRTVRRLIESLAEIARQRGVAIIGVSHITKGTKLTLTRVTGSIAFSAAARAIYAVEKSDDRRRRFLVTLKNNGRSDDAAFEYEICEGKTSSGVAASSIHWMRQVRGEEVRGITQLDGLASASRIMEGILGATNTIRSSELYALAAEHGIGKGRARSILEKMGFNSRKNGFGHEGFWSFTKAEMIPKVGQTQVPEEEAVSQDDWD